MHIGQRPHLLRGQTRATLVPSKLVSNNALENLNNLQPQDRVGQDSLDADTISAETMSSLSDGLFELRDAPSRKHRKQLTSTEYALQEIRNRVRAIDERWEEVNVRATNTLENIDDDNLNEKDPNRRRRGSNPAFDNRREAGNMLKRSNAKAWADDIGEHGRAVTRDERVAMALAKSHESLATAAAQFEESQERSSQLLGGLRSWLDRFTGTARPEDINPIAAMLPEPGLESEVVAIMTDCQDAALMLETSTNRQTEQLREIFCQAGKLYGAEIERVQKKGSAATVAAREKIAGLQEHANNVENLLNSVRDERASLHAKFSGAEQRCRVLEERYREDKARLQEGITKYRHQVIQLQHVVAAYEDKARRQEQIGREPRLAPLLDKLKPPIPAADPEQLQHLQAETARLSSENAVLTEANKKLYRDLVVSRLADQGKMRSAGRRERTLAPATPAALAALAGPEADTPSQADDDVKAAEAAVAEGILRTAKEKAAAAEEALIEIKRENEALSTRLNAMHVELEKEKKKPAVVNPPAADAVEQGLRGAIRDLRRQTSDQLLDEVEARRKAIGELEAALEKAKNKEKAAAEADAELLRLRSELTKTKEEVRALHESAAAEKTRFDALAARLTAPPRPVAPRPEAAAGPPASPPPPPAEPTPAATSSTPASDSEEEIRVLTPVDYGELVNRAVGQEEEGLGELRRKGGEIGVAQRHCGKADQIFSDLVDCCGEGLSTVERILTGTKTIVDDEASSIQEALSVSLERAIGSASLLLKEALIGRIRAYEAEEQASLEKEAAGKERAKAEALCQEKQSLMSELQHHHTRSQMLRKAVAALQREADSARERFRLRREAEEREQEKERAGEINLARVEPPPPLPVVVDDSVTWRRRYEHLAGLLAEQTKSSSGTASQLTTLKRTRPSPRPAPTAIKHTSSQEPTNSQQESTPRSTAVASTSTTGLEAGAPSPNITVAVDGSSNTTLSQLPPSTSSALTAKVSAGSSPKDSGKVITAAPVLLVSAEVSASDVPHSTGDGEGESRASAQTAGTVAEQIALGGKRDDDSSAEARESGSELGIQVGGDNSALVETSNGSTQAGSGIAVIAPGSPEVKDDDVAAKASITAVAGDVEQVLPMQERSRSVSDAESDNNSETGNPADIEPSSSSSLEVPAISTAAHVPDDRGSNGATDGHKVADHAGIVLDRDGIAEEGGGESQAQETSVDSSAGGSSGEREADIVVAGIGTTVMTVMEADHSTSPGFEGGHNQSATMEGGDEEEEEEDEEERRRDNPGRDIQERLKSDGGNSTGNRGWRNSDDTTGTALLPDVAKRMNRNTVSSTDGRGRHESIDGQALLGRLLDERAPSAVFEEDHQKLIHKLMRVRDHEHAQDEAAFRLPSGASDASCTECPVLREKLAEQSTDAETAREQQRAAQDELEASEHRVHVMAADIASLQKKLAEQANVIRQGRALADKVVVAPNADIFQVKAAQDFKELSNKVANARGDNRAERSLRSPTAAANIARGRRVGRGAHSKSPPPSAPQEPSPHKPWPGQPSPTQPSPPQPSSPHPSPQRTALEQQPLPQQPPPQDVGGRQTSAVPSVEGNGRSDSGGDSSSNNGRRSRQPRSSTGSGRHSSPQQRRNSRAGAAEAGSPSDVAAELRLRERGTAGNGVTAVQSAEQEAGWGLPEDASDRPPTGAKAEMVEVKEQVQSEVPNDAIDAVAAGDRQPDDTGAQNDVSRRTSHATDLNADGAQDYGAIDASQAPSECPRKDTSVAKGAAQSGSTPAAKSSQETRVSLPAQGDIAPWSKAIDFPRDESDAVVPRISALESRTSGGHEQLLQQQRQKQRKNSSDPIPASLEAKSATVSPLTATETQARSQETTLQDDKVFPPLSETSWVGRAQEASILEDLDKVEEGLVNVPALLTDRDEDGRRGMEAARKPSFAAASEFVPTEESLAAYCQAAAQCRLVIEAFESSSEWSAGRGSTSNASDGCASTAGDDNAQQQLVERYSVLTDIMMDWGVEAAQALLVEVTKSAAKYRAISAWATSVSGPGNGSAKKTDGVCEAKHGSSATSLQALHARQARAALLLAEKAVLQEVVEALGGWEAAVFLDSGVVNLDVDVAAWPVGDQLHILAALNDHLRDELRKDGMRHDRALGDVLGRLQVAQKEVARLRSELAGTAFDPKSPEATPEGVKADGGGAIQVEKGGRGGPTPANEAGRGDRENSGTEVSTARSGSEARDDAAKAAARQAKQMQMELATALAKLRRAKEGLPNEKVGSKVAEDQLQQQQQQRLDASHEEALPPSQARKVVTAIPAPKAPAAPGSAPLSNPTPVAVQQQVPTRHQAPTPPAPEHKPPPPQPRVVGRHKGLDLIAQADLAERRAREKEEARLRAGYPLAALAKERKAVVDLRTALAKTVCAVLELCQQQQIQPQQEQRLEPLTAAAGGDGAYTTRGRPRGGKEWWVGDTLANAARPPPSTLVQMVCSGEDANVRCATSQYRLCTGMEAASRCSTAAVGYGGRSSRRDGASGVVDDQPRHFDAQNAKHKIFCGTGAPQSPPQSPSLSSSSTLSASQEPSLNAAAESGIARSRLREIATTVKDSGTMSRTIISGLLAAGAKGKARRESQDLSAPPTDPREALLVARAATMDIRAFSNDIKVNVDGVGTAADQMPPPGTCVGVGGDGSVGSINNDSGACWGAQTAAAATNWGSAGGAGGAEQVETTASTMIVDALKRDVLWAESLPGFIRTAMKAQDGGFGQQIALKEREIILLSETQRELRHELRKFKADYISADADDVIRALRKRQRGLNSQVRHLERQLELTRQSAEVEGGAIEVLEGLLQQRDIDTQLSHALGLKSLEIGLKIRLLETAKGGKTVEVSRMSQKEQRAVAHLKTRLLKEREVTGIRKKTVAAELERSLSQSMRAFERVSRTIQRLCNGYTSLPGLLEWGRTTAARLEATRAAGSGYGRGGNVNDVAMDDHTAHCGSFGSSGQSGGGGGSGDGGKISYDEKEGAAAASCAGDGGKYNRRTDNERKTGGYQTGGSGDRATRSAYLGGSGSRSTGDRPVRDLLASSVTTTPTLSTASASASTPLLLRAGNAIPSRGFTETVCFSPKKTGEWGINARAVNAEVARKWLGKAGGAGGGGSERRGVLCGAEYGGGGGDFFGWNSQPGGSDGSGDGASSVASLLREERALRQRSGTLQGSQEAEERYSARGQADTLAANTNQRGHVPALVQLNNVGLPVRLRRQPRRI